jgi:hypothetical protein
LVFKHQDGSEVKPLSLKDFYSKGMDKLDRYVLANKPSNEDEKNYRDALRTNKIAGIQRQLDELKALDEYPRTQSLLTEHANSPDMVIE